MACFPKSFDLTTFRFPLPTIRAFPHLQKPTKLPKPWTFLDIFGFFASWFLRSGFIPRRWSNMVEWPPYAAINLGCPSLVVPYVYTYVYTTHVQENSLHMWWWCTIIDIHAFIIDKMIRTFLVVPLVLWHIENQRACLPVLPISTINPPTQVGWWKLFFPLFQ